MAFQLDTAENLAVSDEEIRRLLTEVYVDGGFTEPERALSVFEPQAVRQRGLLICARSPEQTLAGMIILVPPDSHFNQAGRTNQAELHLLGVKEPFRATGLGKALVNYCLAEARSKGYSKILLWTQVSMVSAQKLYAALGFVRLPDQDFNRNGRDFWFYEKKL